MARRLSRSRMIMYSIVGVVLLVVTGGATWFVINTYFGADSESTEVRSQAASATGTVKLTMETESTTRYQKDAFPVGIYLDTAGTPVSGLAFRIQYNSGAAATPNLQVVDSDGNLSNGVQIQSFANQLDDCMSTQINQVQRSTNAGDKEVFIDVVIACTNDQGYETPDTGKVKIAEVVFLANQPGSVLLEQDVQKAVATAKSGPNAGTDVLQTVPSLPLTIEADSQKPTITFTEGIEEGATATSSTVMVKVAATEQPERADDTIQYPAFLNYRFSLNNTNWTAWSSSPEFSHTFAHGDRSIYAQARDANNNISETIQRSFTANLKPVITSISSESAAGGETITIRGYNFGRSNLKYYVYFGSVGAGGAAIPTWTDTEIVVRVPATGGTPIRVRARDYGLTGENQYSNPVDFQVETRLGIVLNFKEINQDRGERKVDVTVSHPRYETVTLEDQTATWSEADNGYKVITDSLPADFVPTSGYTVSVKGENTLRRSYGRLTLSKGRLNALVRNVRPEHKLLSGDFNNDNKISILDFGRMMTFVRGIETDVDTAGDGAEQVDLNGDGVINIADISLMLSNYTALEVAGE